MAFDRRETAILLIGDFLILFASLWVTLFLRNLAVPSLGYFRANFVPFLPVFLLSLVVFYISGLYEKQTRPIRSVMSIRILGAQVATVAVAAILFFLLPLSIAPRAILALYLAISVAAESAWRFYRMSREITEGKREPALLIGSGPSALELFEEVNGNGRYLIRFSGRLETADLLGQTVREAVAVAFAEGARIFVIDLSDPAAERDMPALYDLISDGAVFIEFSFLYEEIFDRVPLAHIGAKTLLDFLPKRHTLYDTTKRAFDILLAVCAAALAVPFVAAAALALALEGGKPFILPERIGRGGRAIRLLKLRTMLFDDNGDPELQKKNRVTPLGSLLRKSRIDELPQLWNVLIGDLSFIGPRPEFPKIAEVYEREVPQYRMRHLITPGLSGWAQIHDYDVPRGGADVERTKRKVSYDLYYLKHRSFALDLAIAVKTLRTLSAFSGV